MEERVYTVEQVAEKLNISDWKVRNAIEKGNLKALHPSPRTYVVTQTQFDDWVKSMEVQK
jgi:excisionase family DNA binding protein